MIRKISIVAFVLCAFSIQSTQVQAALISFDPSSQSVELGDSVSVDLRISDLGDDSLGAFDIDIAFDDSILDFQSFTFGTGLDVSGLGSVNGFAVAGGDINIFEISLDSPSDLNTFQPNDFVLGSFTFDTLSIGTSTLDLTINALSDEFGFLLEAGAASGSIKVAAASVPAPAALWLFGTGLIGLIGFSRRRKTFVGG